MVYLGYTKGVHRLRCVRPALVHAKREGVSITAYYMEKVPLIPVTREAGIWP